MVARRFKPHLSQLEILGGANQLSYKAFGQLQIVYILELRNTLLLNHWVRDLFLGILQYVIVYFLTFAFLGKILLLIVFLK